MIGKIFKNIFNNFQTFLVVWIVILIANQIFIFGACFAPYCLIAGLPHTGIIAALVTYSMNEDNKENTTVSKHNETTKKNVHHKKIEYEDRWLNNFKDLLNKDSEENSTIVKPINTTIQKNIQYDIEDTFEEAKEPFCPRCGSKMVLRTARKGKFIGKDFWGCSNYPNCTGIVNI